MSSVSTIERGGWVTYVTRPLGFSTNLWIQSMADEHNNAFPAVASWHIELCGQGDRPVTVAAGEVLKLDITMAAGAIVSVKNAGTSKFQTWTDY